ncbi:hypothetical protein KR032_003473 [Drosophila birchii]|nr:hypothetical protein KR032_003473 [Drosophila birchii]
MDSAISSSADDDEIDYNTDVNLEDSNMVIKPDPIVFRELPTFLAQDQQDQDDETFDDDDDEDPDDESPDDIDDEDQDNEDHETDGVNEEDVSDNSNDLDDDDDDDDYLNDTGFEDKTDEDSEEDNMMDHVVFPINPSHEIVRIVDSDLNRREALERIVAYL